MALEVTGMGSTPIIGYQPIDRSGLNRLEKDSLWLYTAYSAVCGNCDRIQQTTKEKRGDGCNSHIGYPHFRGIINDMTCVFMGETDRPMTLVYERDEQGLIPPV